MICEWVLCQAKRPEIEDHELVALIECSSGHSHIFHARCARLYRLQRRCREQRDLN